MDFLRSAVASAIAKGPPFPYSFGDRVDVDESIWTLHNGTKKEDGTNCSIFSYDITANQSRLPLAKNALRKFKTLRHPGVIKVLDTVETDTYIYIATERVVPLRWHVRRKSLSPETIKWGLHSVARTMKFVNVDASSIHGSLKVGSIYTSESGEWKLGGFEVLSSIKEDESTIYTFGSLVPDSARYAPPELAQGGWDVIKKNPHAAVDAFSFGVLMYEAFNGDYNGSGQAGQTKNIPPTMHSSYKRLCNVNPKARISISNFLDQGDRSSSFFDTPLIKLTQGIDNLGVKSPAEREEFLNDLDQVTDDFPEEFFKMKVLPELMKSVEFGGGGPKALGLALKISSNFSTEDFDAKITPFIVRLFGNPDRALRVCLLDNLPLMIDNLSQKIVNDKIFPQLVTGFTDATPVVREQTLKSVLVIITKLSDRTINGELLRHLAKTANDEQPGIRTNTTICLGKIAKNLAVNSRSKVLIAAFTRSLRDGFVHARNAALMALGATSEFFTDADAATKLLPAICPLLLDKEKLVRDQATRAMDVYLSKIRKAAASMPDTVLPPPQAAEGQAPRMGTPQTSESSGWTGWAISSFTNKISAAAGDIQSANGTASNPSARPHPGSTAAPLSRPASATSSTPVPKSSVAKSPLSGTPRTASPNPNAIADAFLADEQFEDVDDSWGNLEDEDEDGFFGSSAEAGARHGSAPSAPAAAAAPFEDEAEPDFAGWLAAQAQKKPGSSKPLPKGLAKPAQDKKAIAMKPKATKPPATSVKKIDLKPKETGDDDGWGDGW